MSDNLEAGKAWLNQQAEEMGATDLQWGRQRGRGDFDLSLRMHIGDSVVFCPFSEFDIARIPTDENVARAARQRLQGCLKRP